ncbi:hypothetical protein CDAR_208101 [Caerostris darwini]|uniref:Uncharacterized protein n=1 Tax=Caerostris darwini TaxID=1538125 RepID=A0AAV4W3K3_9ARAC|nr:hypothetical protein CDAR_208101 [Caerostris darwini]
MGERGLSSWSTRDVPLPPDTAFARLPRTGHESRVRRKETQRTGRTSTKIFNTTFIVIPMELRHQHTSNKEMLPWLVRIEQDKSYSILTKTSAKWIQNGSQDGFCLCSLQGREEISHVSVRLNDEATVYLADLNAIDLAINYILENYIINAEIISDSRSGPFQPLQHLSAYLED